MFLMLPTRKGKEAFETLENQLPNLDFEQMFEKMQPVFGDILLPRMEMEFTANLGPYLSGIGNIYESQKPLYNCEWSLVQE